MNNFYVLEACEMEYTYSFYFYKALQELVNLPLKFSEEDFIKLCDSLVEEAGFAAVKNTNDSFIGVREVVENLIPSLEKQGFINFIPKIAKFYGEGIIKQSDVNSNDSEDKDLLVNKLKTSIKDIVVFNKKISNFI